MNDLIEEQSTPPLDDNEVNVDANYMNEEQGTHCWIFMIQTIVITLK